MAAVARAANRQMSSGRRAGDVSIPFLGASTTNLTRLSLVSRDRASGVYLSDCFGACGDRSDLAEPQPTGAGIQQFTPKRAVACAHRAVVACLRSFLRSVWGGRDVYRSGA